MRRAQLSIFLAGIILLPSIRGQHSFREAVYGSAVIMAGQIVPLYDKGFLVYLHRPNRLQVFRPDTQLAFDLDLPCPGDGQCSATAVAVDGHNRIAVGFAYVSGQSRADGIRMLDLKGQPSGFIETSLYVPTNLCFDRNGELWVVGWQRDSLTGDSETEEDYNLVRRFSADGRLVGQYLPRRLWSNKSSNPGAGGRGYWRMYAAADRIGIIIHESRADNVAEWVEWDLAGKLLSRTALKQLPTAGRAFAAGHLHALFQVSEGTGKVVALKILDENTGVWTVVPDNLPEEISAQGVSLLGADGDDLVYRIAGGGNLRLVWARPGGR